MTRVSRHDALDGGVLNRDDGDACPGRDRYHLRSSVVLEILTLNRLQCRGERCLPGRQRQFPVLLGPPLSPKGKWWEDSFFLDQSEYAVIRVHENSGNQYDFLGGIVILLSEDGLDDR